MASRKDKKGRVLRKGEFQRASDGKYVYGYTDPSGKRHYIYSKDLKKLRDREEKMLRDQLDGLDVYAAGSADINFVFDRYISTKSELRSSTRSNYHYMYDRFVRDGFGKKKIGKVRYSDVLRFYYDLLNNKGLQINLQAINRAIKRIYEAHNAEEILKAKNEHRDPVIIPHFSCHHMRHTFCTRFCENETNVKVIQSIMGHASIETTMDIYAEVTQAKKKEALDNLSANLDVF